MRCVGLAVTVSARHPSLMLVVLDDASGSPAVVLHREFTVVKEDLGSVLFRLANAVGSHLHGALPLNRAVIRLAGTAGRPRPIDDNGRVRLQTEGAVALACREHVVDVRLEPGKQLVDWIPGKALADLDAEAVALVDAASLAPQKGVRERYAVAAAAALAGFSAPAL